MGSPDGTPGSYKLLVEIDNASDRGHGLRGRSMQFAPVTVRYLRVGEGVGDGFYSISEFSAYCQAPYPFPPSMKVTDAPQAVVNEPPWYKFEWWQDKPSARFEMGLAAVRVPAAVLGLAGREGRQGDGPAALGRDDHHGPVPGRARELLLHGRASVRARRYRHADLELHPGPGRNRHLVPQPCWSRPCAIGMLVLVGVLSFFAYFNFGKFHFGNYIHFWDTYHYYVGHEVLQGAVLRSALRVRVGGRLRGAVAAAAGRAAQDHEPAHERPRRHHRDPGAPRELQEPLHAGALGEVQEGHRVLPGAPGGEALGGGADRPRLQRDAGVEHPRDHARQHGAGQHQPDVGSDADRPAVHLRHGRHDLVGVRVADAVRGAGGLRHQLPVAFLLDRGRLPAVGLAVPHDGGGVPRQEGPLRAGRLPHGVLGAAPCVPRCSCWSGRCSC